MAEYLTIKEASNWASEYLKKIITTSNISYLIQYGRIAKHGKNGTEKDKSAYAEIIFHLKAKL